MLYYAKADLKVIVSAACECCGAESDTLIYMPFATEMQAENETQFRQLFNNAIQEMLDTKTRHTPNKTYRLCAVSRYKVKPLFQEILMRRQGYPEMFPGLVKEQK